METVPSPEAIAAVDESYFLPWNDLPDLFHSVALQVGFSEDFSGVDPKAIADSMPRYSLRETADMLAVAQQSPAFDPWNFWQTCFEVPDYSVNLRAIDEEDLTLAEHSNRMWDELEYHEPKDKGSLIGTECPIFKSGRRYNEGYYWDLEQGIDGLLGVILTSGAESDVPEIAWRRISNILNTCANMIDRYGFMPNGLRKYYLTRSQTPKFAPMVKKVYCYLPKEQRLGFIEQYLPQITKEYEWFMKGTDQLDPEQGVFAADHVVLMPDGSVLNRYWDTGKTPRPESYIQDYLLGQKVPESEREALYQNIRAMAESGRDMNGEYMADPTKLETAHTTRVVPVDLNSLLWEYEDFIAFAHHRAGRSVLAEQFSQAADRRAAAINKYLWTGDDATGYYCGFLMNKDFTDGAPTGYQSMTMALPVARDIAPRERSVSVATRLVRDFLQRGGFVASRTYTGQQWDWPNGWAPDQKEGRNALLRVASLTGDATWEMNANFAGSRWIMHNRIVHTLTGKNAEKTSVVGTNPIEVVDGEYPLQDGFLWTNGWLLWLMSQIVSFHVTRSRFRTVLNEDGTTTLKNYQW